MYLKYKIDEVGVKQRTFWRDLYVQNNVNMAILKGVVKIYFLQNLHK